MKSATSTETAGSNMTRETGTAYFAEHRCIPCGKGSWDELPDTLAYMTPLCCGKSMVPTGRVQHEGCLLSIVAKYKESA